MLPEISGWLSASWADYRRRWMSLMAAIAVGGIATAAGAFLPLLPAGIASVLGIGSLWLVWGSAMTVSLLIGLWLSTWAQAAALLAAANDEGAAEALSGGWRQLSSFAWVISLVTLAVGGGFVLLIVPGLLLGVLLLLAPYYQLSGEARGMAALELSYARVLPQFGPVSLRLLTAWAVVALPSYIPWIGWLFGMLMAPFGLVACARLAADLKTLSPQPERPRALGTWVGVLSVVLCLALGAGSWGAARAARALFRSYESGELTRMAPDPSTAQALMAVLQGQGSDEDKRRALEYARSLSSGTAP